LSEADWQKIHQISVEQYQRWYWNYGRSPKSNIQKSDTFPIGKIDVRIEVAKGRIVGVKIYGNFAGKEPIGRLENLLVGVRYEPEALEAALAGEDIRPYFGELEKEAFLALLF
jgi:lipoate-protein ligase A